MRINFMSDVHLEFGAYNHEMPKGDVLLLAGDITLGKFYDPELVPNPPGYMAYDSEAFFSQASDNHKHVLYIPGNHEPYGHDIVQTNHLIKRALQPWPNIHYGQAFTKVLDGVAFVCASLWSDCAGHHTVQHGMNDFRLITNGNGGRWSTAQASHLHRQHRNYISRNVNKHRGKPTVVMTHHAPTFQLCNHGRYTDRSIDPGYATDLEKFIAIRPTISNWVCGHTHVCKTLQIGETIVRANSRGYESSGERTGFNPKAHFKI